jgi:hypothetical protein
MVPEKLFKFPKFLCDLRLYKFQIVGRQLLKNKKNNISALLNSVALNYMTEISCVG